MAEVGLELLIVLSYLCDAQIECVFRHRTGFNVALGMEWRASYMCTSTRSTELYAMSPLHSSQLVYTG